MANVIAGTQEYITQNANCGCQFGADDDYVPSGGGKSWSKLMRVKSKHKADSIRRTMMDKMPYIITDTKCMGSVRFVTRVYRNMPRNKEVTSVVIEVKRQGAWYPVDNEGSCSEFPSVMSL